MIFWEQIHTIAFDFDGIFTDNKVLISQDGIESVKCDRSDSLGLDILRNFIIKNNWDLDYFIITRESNSVVKMRAEKLKIKCFDSVFNKMEFIRERIRNRFGEEKNISQGLIYLGNDLNDLEAMRFAGLSVAPLDANQRILKIASIVINKKGGDGFVREFIELLLNLKENDDFEIEKILKGE